MSGNTPSVPPELTSATAKLIYVYLGQVGRATAEEMKTALALPLAELLAVLRVLRTERFVERRDDGYALV